MAKCNSLRSLKKRRRSVDKRGCARKERRKIDSSPRPLSDQQLEEQLKENSPVEEEAVKNELEGDEENRDWSNWLGRSTLANVYSWCQSTMSEGVEVFKDTVFPTRALRRELCEVTHQLHLMERKLEHLSAHTTQTPDNSATSVPAAPPPVAPPPPPVSQPAPAISFKARSSAAKPIKKEMQQNLPIVTLSDIQHVHLRPISTNNKAREQPVKSPEGGLLRPGLKRCHYRQRDNQFYCSPKLLASTRKRLKTTGIDRTPGGTPITSMSHDASVNKIK